VRLVLFHVAAKDWISVQKQK